MTSHPYASPLWARWRHLHTSPRCTWFLGNYVHSRHRSVPAVSDSLWRHDQLLWKQILKKQSHFSRNYFAIWQGAQAGAHSFWHHQNWVTTLSEKSSCTRLSPLLSSVIIHCKLKVISLACIPFISAPFYAGGFYIFVEKCHSRNGNSPTFLWMELWPTSLREVGQVYYDLLYSLSLGRGLWIKFSAVQSYQGEYLGHF